MADRVGLQLGNYQLLHLLGEGGFAEVYLGEHIHLGTQAAIKVLHTQLTSEDIDKFRTEARTIARLIHPHIVRVLDFGVEGKTPFLVMDFASHGTLRQYHPKGTILPLDTIISYVKQVADALQYAHHEKVIHRDIKPENMLLGRRNEILLSDFGIALVAQSSRYQSTQEMAGTMAYMAPEQIQGKPRPASDQYALGIVVYEWISGDRPFHGSLSEMVGQHLSAPPPSLQEKVPTIPSTVEQVVLKVLAKDPKERFASVQAFANALEQASQTTLSRPVTLPSEDILSNRSSSRPNTVAAISTNHLPLPPNVDKASSAPLRITLTISKAEAFLGTTRTLPIGGRRMTVRVPANVHDGQIIRLESQDGSSNAKSASSPIIAIAISDAEETSAATNYGNADKTNHAASFDKAEQGVFTTKLKSSVTASAKKRSNRAVGVTTLIIVVLLVIVGSGQLLYSTITGQNAAYNAQATASAETSTTSAGTSTISAGTSTSYAKGTATAVPTSTPPATPTPTPTPPVLTASPTSIYANTDCQLTSQNHTSWSCVVTLYNSPKSSSSLNWTASANIPSATGVIFTPKNGTLQPGHSIQVDVNPFYMSCPDAGTLTFTGSVNSVTIPWRCTAPTLVTINPSGFINGIAHNTNPALNTVRQ